jgi:hypothetical protein
VFVVSNGRRAHVFEVASCQLAQRRGQHRALV